MSMRFLQNNFLLGLVLLANVGGAQASLQMTANNDPAQQHLSYRAIDVKNSGDQAQIIKSISSSFYPESVNSQIQFCDQKASCEQTYTNTCQSGTHLAPGEQCTIWLHAVSQDALTSDAHGQLQLTISTQKELVPPVTTTFAIDYSEAVYAGGRFDAPASGIARWDGATWQALNDGLFGGDVAALASYHGDLYATGSFYEADNEPVNFMARWNGDHWQPVGNGVGDPGGDTLAVYKNNLVVGGGFDYVGEQNANYLGRWDAVNWIGLKLGINNPINEIIANADHLYIGGEFTQVDNQVANHLAVETDGHWHALGAGVNASIRALSLDQQGDLYVGGLFDQAGNAAAAHIAKWKNNQWSTLGAGVNEKVLALAADRDQLFAAGGFTQADNLPVNFIAQWDGAKWNALAGGVTVASYPKYTQVYALALHGQQLYAGGYFTQAHNKDGNVAANYIAVWDREKAQWQALGDGVNNLVKSIVVLPALKITPS